MGVAYPANHPEKPHRDDRPYSEIADVWQWDFEERRFLPNAYSTDIAAAFQVVERMRELGWEVEVDSHSEPSSTWRVRFEPRKHETTSLANRVWAATIEWDASLPLAICKAALDALSNSLMKV